MHSKREVELLHDTRRNTFTPRRSSACTQLDPATSWNQDPSIKQVEETLGGHEEGSRDLPQPNRQCSYSLIGGGSKSKAVKKHTLPFLATMGQRSQSQDDPKMRPCSATLNSRAASTAEEKELDSLGKCCMSVVVFRRICDTYCLWIQNTTYPCRPRCQILRQILSRLRFARVCLSPGA